MPLNLGWLVMQLLITRAAQLLEQFPAPWNSRSFKVFADCYWSGIVCSSWAMCPQMLPLSCPTLTLPWSPAPVSIPETKSLAPSIWVSSKLHGKFKETMLTTQASAIQLPLPCTQTPLPILTLPLGWLPKPDLLPLPWRVIQLPPQASHSWCPHWSISRI